MSGLPALIALQNFRAQAITEGNSTPWRSVLPADSRLCAPLDTFFYTRDSALSILIRDMKYRHFPGIGEMLGSLAAAELFPAGFFEGIEHIVPVPMHFFQESQTRLQSDLSHCKRGERGHRHIRKQSAKGNSPSPHTDLLVPRRKTRQH